MTRPEKLLEPADKEELLRGWLLHAHKARDRHGLAAQECERRRLQIGVPAIALPAIAGTSVFASIGSSPNTALVILVGSIGVTAAVLTALQTFLDYPGRATRHHRAGARYKAFVRELEQLLEGRLDKETVTQNVITDLRQRLDALEELAPVVGRRISGKVDDLYEGFMFVPRTEDLAALPKATTQGIGAG